MRVRLVVEADSRTAATAAADLIASRAAEKLRASSQFAIAFSGGSTPALMFAALAEHGLEWSRVHVAQVDERVAPAGDAARNLTQLEGALLSRVPIPASHVHAMPVETADLESGAAEYAARLRTFAGTPPTFDVVHLGLGSDGHTASLVPGGAALDEVDVDVTATEPYQGRRRMTLTYPVINRARLVVWLVTGADKAEQLERLLKRDTSIPAGRVEPGDAVVFADSAAAPGVSR